MKNMDWDSVPDQTIFPDGPYTVAIEELGPEANKSGKLMYKVELRVQGPKAFANMPIYENFVFGSDDDLEADDPETVKKSIGARRMKTMFKAAQVPFAADMDEMCANAKGNQLIVVLSQQKEPEMKKINGVDTVNQYAGQVRNKITAFQQVGSADTNGTKPAATKAAAKPIVTKAAPATGPMTIAKSQEKAQAAKKAAAGGGTATATMPKVATVKCGICSEVVAKAEYPEHVQAHADAGGSEDEE